MAATADTVLADDCVEASSLAVDMFYRHHKLEEVRVRM